MKILKVNGHLLDIDTATSIGVTFQAMDLTDPGKRKVKFTNTFTIPKTANNMRIFGNPGSPHSIDTLVYDSQLFDYYEDNLAIIDGGKVSVEDVQDRISISAVDKTDIWDMLKMYKCVDFWNDLFEWLPLPKKSAPVIDSFANFLYPYSIATDGVYLPLFFSNLYGYELNEGEGNYIETPNNIWLRYGSLNGGHFCIYYKTIFQFIEERYNVNFLTSGGILPGNIWDDAYASKFYHTFRNLDIAFNYSGSNVTGYYFRMPSRFDFAPHGDISEMSEKTVFDIVNCFFQYFNVIKDDVNVSGNSVIRLARWDDIDKADVIDWSQLVTGTPKFYPKIDGYAQNNRIKFSSVYDGGSEELNSKNLTSLNKNIEATKDLFSIDAYIPGLIGVDNSFIPDLSPEASFQTNTGLIDSGSTKQINVYCGDGNQLVGALLTLNVSSIYSLDGEYNLLDSVLKYPKRYDIQKYLSLYDLIGIEFFKQYYIRELGASFYINKISGFNSSAKNKATTIELIKISDKTPIYPSDLEYYSDGINDAFTDGVNDYFY